MFNSNKQTASLTLLVLSLGCLSLVTKCQASSLSGQELLPENYATANLGYYGNDDQQQQQPQQQIQQPQAYASNPIPNAQMDDSEDEDEEEDVANAQAQLAAMGYQPNGEQRQQAVATPTPGGQFIDEGVASGRYQQVHPAGDLRTAASHHKHHKGHGAKGWLDMGAWTGKKGAFGWHDKHPVGGKGRK